MKSNPFARAAVAAVIAAHLAGCAGARSAAPQPVGAIGECAQLHAEIARAEQARRTALEKQQGAWKAVIPFAVAARYANGKSAVSDADRRLADLRRELVRRNCQ